MIGSVVMILSKYKKSNKKIKNKVETSKKLAWFSGICFAVAILYTMFIFTYCVMTGSMCDFTLPITLVSVTGAAFGVTMVTYGNKSRFENVIKLQNASLKLKYLILKAVGLLDEYRIQSELDSELSKIESDFDNEKSMSNQEITYNG